MKSKKIFILLAALALSLGACETGTSSKGGKKSNTSDTSQTSDQGSGGGDTVAVTSVTLSKKTLTLTEEKSETLSATVLPENASNTKLTWSISDPEIASVTQLGKVTAIKAGTATITVASQSNPEVSDTCALTVEAKKEPIGTLEKPVTVAEALEVIKNLEDSKGKTDDGKSYNKNIFYDAPFYVTGTIVGGVKAGNTAGTYNFKMYDNNTGSGKSITCYYIAAAAGVTPKDYSKVVVYGLLENYGGEGEFIETYDGVDSKILSAVDGTAPERELDKGETEDDALSVSEAINLMKTLSDNKNTLFDYFVTGPIHSIKDAYSDQYKNVSLYIGTDEAKVQLFRAKLGEGVSKDDLVVGKQLYVKGRLYHYVSTTQQGVEEYEVAEGGTITRILDVEPESVAVTAAGSATSVRVGETLQLSASVLPAVAPQNVTWSSSDPTKASVDANGLVTGVAEAEEVTITATSSKATVKGEIKLAVAPKASVLAQSITVDASAELVLGGNAKELDYTLAPEGCVAAVTVSSDHPEFVTATATGGKLSLTPVAIGSANITLSATQGTDDTSDDVSKTVAVTVRYAKANEIAVDVNSVITGKVMAVSNSSKTNSGGKYYSTLLIDDGTAGIVAYYVDQTATAALTYKVGDVLKVTGKGAARDKGIQFSASAIESATAEITPTTATAITPEQAQALITAKAVPVGGLVSLENVAVTSGSGAYMYMNFGGALMETSVATGGVAVNKLYNLEGYLYNLYQDKYLTLVVTKATAVKENIAVTPAVTGTCQVGGGKATVSATTAGLESDTYSFKSADEKIATVAANGEVTGVAGGKVNITVTSNTYGTSKAIEVTVKAAAGTVLAEASASSVAVGSTITITASTVDVADDTYTYASSNTSKATVSDAGVVTGVAVADEVTITVTSVADSSKKAEIKIAVTEAGAVAFAVAKSIAAGDTVYLACNAVSKQYAGPNNANASAYGTASDFVDSKPVKTGLALIVEAGAADGTFSFKIASGDYKDKYLAWSSGNSLKVDATKDNNSSWVVTFDADGNATIKNKADETRIIWWNVSSPRFACYTSKSNGDSYKYVQLWK